MEETSTIKLAFVALALGLVVFALMPFLAPSSSPAHNDAGYAAVTAPDINTRTQAGNGVGTQALSYCAHWFSRDGHACIGTATAGQLVVVDTGIPKGSSGDITNAASHCQSSGCKVALYCECENAGQVQQLVQNFYSPNNARYPGIFLPQVEVDGMRDLREKSSAAAQQVTQALGANGLSLILKNDGNVGFYSGYTPVARVVFEDIVNDSRYRGELAQLVSKYPNLMLTAIVHQGAYGGDRGATLDQAMQVFQQFAQAKNVELFYGLPTSFQKIKSFDGGLVAQQQGSITGRFAPPPFNIAQSGVTPASVAQGLSTPQPAMTPSVGGANAQPFQYVTAVDTSTTSVPVSTILASIQAIASGATSTATSGVAVQLIGALSAGTAIQATSSATTTVVVTIPSTPADTFASQNNTNPQTTVPPSILATLAAAVANLLHGVIALLAH